MVIKKTELCRKYRINSSTLNNYIQRLPEPYRLALDINGNRYYNHGQLEIMKQWFGDWNKYCFKTKSQICTEYGISRVTMKKILVEALGREHEIVNGKLKLYTARQVELIEKSIGEP